MFGPACFTNGAGGEAVGRELQGRVGQMGACREKGKQASPENVSRNIASGQGLSDFEMINLKPDWLDMYVFSSTWSPPEGLRRQLVQSINSPKVWDY